MGIDARGYFVTKRPLSDGEIGQILAKFQSVFYWDWEISFHSLRNAEGFNDRCVEIGFGFDRLYSAAYARGNFIKQASICGWLRRRPYVEAVYHGGDTGDLIELGEWTEEKEWELFDMYLRSNNESYRRDREDSEPDFP